MKKTPTLDLEIDNNISIKPFLIFEKHNFKGTDKNKYNIQIFKSTESITFHINDCNGTNYKIELTLDKFYNINRFFKQYSSIEEISILLKNMSDHEIFIIKRENAIILNYKFEFHGIKNDIIFTLYSENLNIKNTVFKLCDKITEIDEINKIIKEHNKIYHNIINELAEFKVKKENDKDLLKFNLEKKAFLFKIWRYIKSNIIIFPLFILFFFMDIYFLKKIKEKDNLINELKQNMNIINKNDINNIKSILDIISEEYRNNLKFLKNEINMSQRRIENNIYNSNTVNNDIMNILNKLMKKNKEFEFINEINYYYIFRYFINIGINQNFNKIIKNYSLIYKASRDGFKAQDFHRKCDGKDFTVTFILTKDGRLFGGFTDDKWDQSGLVKFGDKGFIFSLNNIQIYYNKNIDNNKYNIICNKYNGPIFGNFGIKISDNCNANYDSYDHSSISYETNGEYHPLAKKEYFSVLDYKVYRIELE